MGPSLRSDRLTPAQPRAATGDRAALGIGGDLSQRDLILADPGTEGMERTEVIRPVVRPAAGLTVDSDQTITIVSLGGDRDGSRPGNSHEMWPLARFVLIDE